MTIRGDIRAREKEKEREKAGDVRTFDTSRKIIGGSSNGKSVKATHSPVVRVKKLSLQEQMVAHAAECVQDRKKIEKEKEKEKDREKEKEREREIEFKTRDVIEVAPFLNNNNVNCCDNNGDNGDININNNSNNNSNNNNNNRVCDSEQSEELLKIKSSNSSSQLLNKNPDLPKQSSTILNIIKDTTNSLALQQKDKEGHNDLYHDIDDDSNLNCMKMMDKDKDSNFISNEFENLRNNFGGIEELD